MNRSSFTKIHPSGVCEGQMGRAQVPGAARARRCAEEGPKCPGGPAVGRTDSWGGRKRSVIPLG